MLPLHIYPCSVAVFLLPVCLSLYCYLKENLLVDLPQLPLLGHTAESINKHEEFVLSLWDELNRKTSRKKCKLQDSNDYHKLNGEVNYSSILSPVNRKIPITSLSKLRPSKNSPPPPKKKKKTLQALPNI